MTDIATQIAEVRSRLGLRKCGPCTECCKWIGVEEIQKDCAETCRFEVEGGCGIYEDRPGQCKGFYCIYRAGWGESDALPRDAGWLGCQAEPLFEQERMSILIWRDLDQLTDEVTECMQQQLLDFISNTLLLAPIRYIAITDAATTAASNWTARVLTLKPAVFGAIIRWSITLARSQCGAEIMANSESLTVVQLQDVAKHLATTDIESLSDPNLIQLLEDEAKR